MSSPETQRVEEDVVIFEDDNGMFSLPNSPELQRALKVLTNDRQHILEVLKEGVERNLKNPKNAKLSGDEQWLEGYNNGLLKAFSLLQETLGEGKEINSIFKG